MTIRDSVAWVALAGFALILGGTVGLIVAAALWVYMHSGLAVLALVCLVVGFVLLIAAVASVDVSEVE